MSAYQFVETNRHRILNIDGCLTESANITLLDVNGKMVFYYFENGKLIDSKMGR
jgi:hypothetical protein